MLASAPAVFSALLALQGTTELGAGARVETRAGSTPAGSSVTDTGQTVLLQQRQVLVSATPLLNLRWSGQRSEVRANSATRILWRPVPLYDRRPLFLETLDTSFLTRPDRRTRLQLDLLGSCGELDYTSLAQQFVNQPALPLASTLLTVNLTGDGSWRATRRTTLSLALGAVHRRALDSQVSGSDGSGYVLPTQTFVTLTPGLRHAVDRRTSIEGRLELAESDLRRLQFGTTTDGHANILTVQPQVGLLRALSRKHQIRASAGLNYAAVLVNPDEQRDWLAVTPILRTELNSLLRRTRVATVRSSLGAGTSWYADPVLGAAVWRGTLDGRLDAQLGWRWNASLRAAFITDLNKPLAPVVAGALTPDETIVLVDLPVRCRWNEHLDLEFGARYAERGPNLAAGDFAWRNRELWMYLTLLVRSQTASLRSGA